MTFTSISYFLFLPAIYLIFYLTADRWRWLVLLTASYGFYATFKAPYLIAVLLMVTGISYACGLRIAAQQDDAVRKRWLWIGCFACVAILAIMKYLPFLEVKANRLFGLDLPPALISIGVSYFTFQAISYMADIFLEIEEPEHHLGRFALYMAFFPKLLQGPIERSGTLLPQLKRPYQFDYDNMRFGMLLFTWGLFKKVVIADRLGLYADHVYNNVHAFTGLPLLLATYAYAFQIYIDFSGYTDMALGSARLFNINLTQNFNSPYQATSVADFWRRWHISFSRWILDYIFKPLQLQWRNGKKWGTAAALVVTFIISGIWHGASWGFVFWGGIHGVYMACSVFYKPYQKKLHTLMGLDNSRLLKVWQIIVTFNLASIAWVFFRSASLNDSMYVLTNILNVSNGVRGIWSSYLKSQSESTFITLVIMSTLLLIISMIVKSKAVTSRFLNNAFLRWSCYYLLVMVIILFTVPKIKPQFLYFAF